MEKPDFTIQDIHFAASVIVLVTKHYLLQRLPITKLDCKRYTTGDRDRPQADSTGLRMA